MLLLCPEILLAAISFAPWRRWSGDSAESFFPAGMDRRRKKFDPIVPASETRQLVELLRHAGADVTIRFLEGGHELTRHDVDAPRKWLTTFE